MSADKLCLDAECKPKPHVYEARIDVLDERHAQIVATALSVDEELRPSLVTRSVTAVGSILQIHVAACDPRSLRTSALSILDFAIVSLRALDAFVSPPGGT